MRRAYGIGRRVMLTTMRAAPGQPLLDGAHSSDNHGRQWGGVAIRLPLTTRTGIVAVLGARVPFAWRRRLRNRLVWGWRKWRWRTTPGGAEAAMGNPTSPSVMIGESQPEDRASDA